MKQIKEKIAMMLVIGIIYLLLLSPLAFASSFSRSTPQFSAPGSSVSYLAKQGVALDIEWDSSKCEAGQDFVLQIDPAGCSPSVVRSDLLEEQNQPIFCPISATKINPLIDVDAIKDMKLSFNGTKPKEVAGVAFHPARAALRSSNTLLNSPILDNVGYAVIVLKQTKNESSMPDWVEGDLKVDIRYDIKNAFGIGRAVYYLPEVSEEEWSEKHSLYGFWSNKFFLRAEDVGTNGADIGIYTSQDLRHTRVSLKKGKTSNTIYLPGQYCKAGVELKLESLNNPGTRVKLKVDDDFIEVIRGEWFLDNNCKVTKIDDEYVHVYCKVDEGANRIKLSRSGMDKIEDGDANSYYDKAIENYKKVVEDHPSERVISELGEVVGNGEYFGERALYEAYDLATYFGEYDEGGELDEMLESYYGKSANAISLKDSRILKVNGASRSFGLIGVEMSDFEDYGVEVKVNGEEGKLEKDKQETIGDLKVTLDKLTEKYARFKIKSGDKSTTVSVNDGESKKFKLNKEEHTIKVDKIHLTRIAKVKLTPKINYAKTDSKLHFKIGIEKRAIQLSDEKIKEMVKNLNETIEKWQERANNLGKVVKTMKGACLATGLILTAKNLFTGITSSVGTVSREYTMRGSDGRGGVMQWCAEEEKDKENPSITKCVNENKALIDELDKINKKVLGEQQTILKSINTRCPQDGADDIFGEVKDSACVRRELAKEIGGNINPEFSTIKELRNLQYYNMLESEMSGASINAEKILQSEISKQGPIEAKIGNLKKSAEDAETAALEAFYSDTVGKSIGQYPIAGKDATKVKYLQGAPNEGVPAIVPIADCISGMTKKEGWYVATSSVLTGTTHESGTPKVVYLCNAGENGRIEFNTDTASPGNDPCTMVDTNFGLPENAKDLFGIGKDLGKLYSGAGKAYREAATNYREGVKNVKVCGKSMTVDYVADIPTQQCQEFMDPEDCYILFNICDPVVCPSSRCNFGGKHYVDDVIQSGIIGSSLACLHNFGDPTKGGVVIPVCLSGIHAGMEGLLSVFKAYRDCLTHKQATGENIGLCDEIYSIYMCDFFWKQVAPFADIIIPKLLEVVTGQFIRGGGEYKGVQSAWDNAGKSVNFFTQYYAVNAFKMFKAKTITEVGSEVCRNSMSATYPKDFLDVLTDPVSPPQYHGWLDYTLYSSATTPVTNQYSVFYHIYGGTEKDEIEYLVYLKSDPGIGGGTRNIDRGKIEKGGYKTEKKDFTAEAGYTQLCIIVDTKEECGFGKVTSSYALDATTQYFTDQEAEKTNIDSQDECVSGGHSVGSFVNPNLQSGAQGYVSPNLRGMGITRICSTENPGGKSSTDWDDVGHCGDAKMRCWLDKKSVKQAQTLTPFNETGVIDEAARLKAEFEKDFYDFTGGNDKLKDLNDNLTDCNTDVLKGVIKEIEAIQAGEDEDGNEVKMMYFEYHRAGLQLLKGKAYDKLARCEMNDARSKGDEDVERKSLSSDEQSETETDADKDYDGEDKGEDRGDDKAETSEGEGKSEKDCQKEIGDEILKIAKELKHESYDESVKRDTGAKNFECLALQVAIKESNLKHCKELNGDNCFECTEILMGSDKKSTGVMQLNEQYFSADDTYEFENNVRAGVNHLISKYKEFNRIFGNGGTMKYDCQNPSVTYTGWQGALRLYNGDNRKNCEAGNSYYVEEVIEEQPDENMFAECKE